MSETHQVVFLFDVDDTLLDNDRMKSDLGSYVETTFGPDARDELWRLYEEQRKKHGYADFLGTLERFRLSYIDDMRVVTLANWVIDYPYAERLYPGALDAVRHVAQWGLPVILTDGDGVYQPHKLERAGLTDLFAGRILNYVHKETELDAIMRAFPAEHYVLIDDKLSLLAAIKGAWGDKLTTVFPHQGHYANDPEKLKDLPPADIEIARIADLVSHDFSTISRPKEEIKP